MSRTAFVYFDSPRGTFGNVTAGNTLMEAASHALDWVTEPHWKGPRPLPSTVLDISLVGDERRWRVRAQRVIEWREHRAALAGTRGRSRAHLSTLLYSGLHCAAGFPAYVHILHPAHSVNE